MGALAPAHRPRRPTATVLYSVVRSHLESFLAHTRETYEAPLPRYVEEELRGYLRCGVFAQGFVRAHCDACGHDLLVAFSCQGRGVCPSCAGRRTANVAAHLVERVLPAVPVRQWVLSLPFELRALAAFRADVLAALVRIFVEALLARHRAWAKRVALGDGPTGAVTHVQRFGSSLNLNVHFHVMVLDGVFTRDDGGRVVFHPAPPPTREELDEVVRRVQGRAAVWLARKGHLGGAPHDATAAPPTPLDACAAIAMHRGAVRVLGDDPAGAEDVAAGLNVPRPSEGAVERDGFNLHASVAIAADDDLGRERLMRYGARPPLALDRLRRLPGGRIAYRIKTLRGGRAKHRVMTPLELLARLAALVPPPRYPLLRYHGVLAPRSPWRRDVVPRAPEAKACTRSTERTTDDDPPRPEPRGAAPHVTRRGPRSDGAPPRGQAPTPVAAAQPGTEGTPPVAISPTPVARSDAGLAAALLTPNVLRVKHWNRLLGGLLYAGSPRVDWPTLLRRAFEVDVLSCPSCGGRLRVRGQVTESAALIRPLRAGSLPVRTPMDSLSAHYPPPYQRDWDRITFCPAFRRLQDKTQVFPLPEEDSVHSRLTHSIEVASVGRSLGTAIGREACRRDEALLLAHRPEDFAWIVSAACLAHDIGNPPFGHIGEDTIATFFVRTLASGPVASALTERERVDLERFEGNAQGFRTVTRLQYETDGGMCLTSAVLGAFSKYPREAGPGLASKEPAAWRKHGIAQAEVPLFERAAEELGLPRVTDASGRKQWRRHPLAYLVEAADDICYATLDLEDGIRLGLVPLGGETLDTLAGIASMNDRFDGARFRGLSSPSDKAEYLRALVIDKLARDAVDVFLANYDVILEGDFASSLVKESAHAKDYAKLLEVAAEHCYRSPRVLEVELGGHAALSGLLGLLVPAVLEPKATRKGELALAWQLLAAARRVSEGDSTYTRIARVVDFIAEMTDRHALVLYGRLRGFARPGRSG